MLRTVIKSDTGRNTQFRDGKWHNIQKNPLDTSKASKTGLLSLIKENGAYKTVDALSDNRHNLLETVFLNGELIKEYSFQEVRCNAHGS